MWVVQLVILSICFMLVRTHMGDDLRGRQKELKIGPSHKAGGQD